MRRLLCALALLGSPVVAQDENPKTQDEVLVEADYLTSWPEGDLTAMYLLNPKMKKGEIEIRADHMILWYATKGGIQGFSEIYAEGQVVYRRGERELKCQRLYYDAVTDRAYVLHIKARGRDPKYGVAFQLSVGEAREIRSGLFDAKDISISTCEYGVPHFDIYVEEGRLEGHDPREIKGPYDLFPYTDWTLKGRNVAPRIGGVPFLYIPGFSVWKDLLSDFPLRSVHAGRTSRFGFFVLSDWGVTLRKGGLDRILPGDNVTEDDDHEKWGELRWELDWREERGGAYGLDLEYQWNDYWGYLDTYFLHDLGRSDKGFDEKFGPLERDERARARYFHRHDFEEDWRYEVEISWIGDRDLLEEFYPDEFKEGKEQESVLYLRWRNENAGAFLLERHRLNDFQTQIEYLPRLQLHLVAEPIASSVWDRILYTTVNEISHQRLKLDEELAGPEPRVWRVDSLHEITLPIDLEVVQIAPFTSVRGTMYDEDLEGETEFRWVWSAGASARTDIHGAHDLTWEWLGLRRLRHILQLEARFAEHIRVDRDPSEFVPFDETDAIAEFAEASFSVRNRLQTKDAEGKTFEFLDFGLQVEYYPHPRRDTRAFTSNNFEPPFHWITLAPPDLGGPFDERHWSNLHWDVRVTPRNVFTLEGRGEYNFEDHQEEAREFSLGVRPFEALSFSIGSTFIRDITNAWTGSLNWQIAEKWYVSVAVSYDFRTDDFIDQTYVLGRDFHDFILEGVFENDEGRDDRRFYVTLVPKFLGSRGLSSSRRGSFR